MIELQLVGVRVELPTNQPIVLLREREGERFLPIWIGAVEATAIAFALQGIVTPRPMTHDLLKNVIEQLNVQVYKIIGITYRQLDYWARTKLLEPSIKAAVGSGSQRQYSFTDIVHLKIIKNLLDAGVSLQQTRRAVDFLRTELKQPLEEVTIMSDGHSIYACRSRDEVIDLLAQGQGVFGIAVG